MITKMTKEEFHECVELANLDEAFNGYRKTAQEYIQLILQCWGVIKRIRS